MVNSNEYVTIGHPDSVADGITSYILDRFLEKDKQVRYAVECQIKDNHVTLAGEVTSRVMFTNEQIKMFVGEAIDEIGYTQEYSSHWPNGATLSSFNVDVNILIGRQSQDIAQGVNQNGWGDQGVFAGMAVNDSEHGFMPIDRYYSNELGKALYKKAVTRELPIGLDIKTLVTTHDQKVCEVIVAAPMMKDDESAATNGIKILIHSIIPNVNDDVITINGTGSYVIHSSVGDCGTTGRKLAVNFYGLSCPIGGGAPWSKDPSKADVTLNLACRYYALKKILEDKNLSTCYVKMSCCIGKPDVMITYFDENWKVIDQSEGPLYPNELIDRLKLREPNYFNLCRDGLFSSVDEIALSEAAVR